MAKAGATAVELKRNRELLIARAALEREAMRDATQDFQIASERIARIAVTGITLVRRYGLPASLLLAGGLFKRARPVLRMVRTVLTVWQAAKLLRAPRDE
jgi:hypothetical protein